jgi:peptidyl-prolyl cis-trans isomerase SurA
MKSILLLLTLACNFSVLFSQTLFSYGNTAVDKAEFLRAYNKNKTTVEDKEKALKEYLDLYSKFKLKVRAAKDMRLDTMPQLLNDLQNFRSQIDEAYMNNDNALNGLIDEAFVRSQKDVHVIHFFTPTDAKTTAADEAKATKAMQELYSDLMMGKKDYEKLAADISAKYVKVKSSDIGFITAFSVPYEYENIIYSLKNGEANKPYRSKKGLHVFKVVEDRKAMGKWRVAQILLAMPPGDATANYKLLQQKADSIYLKLQAGGDFEELAKQYSDDKLTYLSGGTMPEFTTGKFEQPFETAVFKLTKDGEITKPFASPYGMHIVKRLAVAPVKEDKNDVAYLYEIKQKVTQDARISMAKDLFTKSVIKVVGYKKNAAVKDTELFRYADSVVANPGANGAKVFPVSNKTIYTSAKSILKGKDWLNFVREYKTNPEIYKGETNTALLEKFVSIKSSDFYKAHLEEYSPEFKYQMEEFKEGNLLFEIMERKVWSSAAGDSAGLMKYYIQNKSKYQWAASADVIIVSCNNQKTAEQSLAAIKAGKDWKKIAEESNGNVQTDSGRYELVQLSLAEGTAPTPGMFTPINVSTTDGTAGFIKILQLHPANQQRSFEEARGLVINDYQNVLEEKWIVELKKKYPVKVDQGVFEALVK